MMKYVHDSAEPAREALGKFSDKYRVYEVTQAGRKVYVVAISPTDAIGKAGDALGIEAKALDPKYSAAQKMRKVKELLQDLSPEDRQKLKKAL